VAGFVLSSRASALPLIEDVLETSRTTGYLHFEGLACWLMGAALGADAPASAENYLETAMRILEGVGARNDLARALVARANLCQSADDVITARRLFEQACAIFRILGTRDEPGQVEAALAADR